MIPLGGRAAAAPEAQLGWRDPHGLSNMEQVRQRPHPAVLGGRLLIGAAPAGQAEPAAARTAVGVWLHGQGL